jgi:uncharacterized paraquat-inducible protein A
MDAPKKSYQCSVCQWRGELEPMDVGDSAPCPQCGVYLYPLSWAQTWGVALALIGAAVAFVLVAARMLTWR